MRLVLVVAVTVATGAFALARAGKSMWITSFAGSDVCRYTP